LTADVDGESGGGEGGGGDGQDWKHENVDAPSPPRGRTVDVEDIVRFPGGPDAMNVVSGGAGSDDDV